MNWPELIAYSPKDAQFRDIGQGFDILDSLHYAVLGFNTIGANKHLPCSGIFCKANEILTQGFKGLPVSDDLWHFKFEKTVQTIYSPPVHQVNVYYLLANKNGSAGHLANLEWLRNLGLHIR